MKKLIFIDNDLEKSALEDVDYVKDKLEYWGGLTSDEVNTIEVKSDFSRMNKDDAMKMIFNPNNCICTWSMYTHNHYSSLYQLFNFLASAGRNEVKDLVYFDGSGKIHEALERNIRDDKNSLAILNAIETNYIITSDSEKDNTLFRVRVKLIGYHEDPFYLEEINMRELLNK